MNDGDYHGLIVLALAALLAICFLASEARGYLRRRDLRAQLRLLDRLQGTDTVRRNSIEDGTS